MLTNSRGHVNVTVVDGTTFTGLYGTDGSLNVFDASGVTTPDGLYHRCGAMNVFPVDGSTLTGRYAPNGSIYVVDNSTQTGINHSCGAMNVVGMVLPVEMHTDGMLFEYRFAEGSGTTVADSMAGTYPINLDLPTTPNYTWTSKGVSLASGLIQTPSIPGLRTVAVLYRVQRGEVAGFTISGGASSGSGWIGSAITSDASEPGARVYVNGALRAMRRTTSGLAANVLNRGGYVLAFRRFSTSYTTALGFGGRHSTTTSRCALFEAVWAGGWNDVLTDAEMIQVGDSLRPLATARGVYIHKEDCPTQADCALLWGQSNADGRALLTDLALAERTYAATKTYIEAANNGTRATPPAALLVMGTNQIITSPSTQFGPEYGLAKRRDAAGSASRDLYVSKTAAGSTFIAPSSVGAPVTVSNTWAPGETPTNSLLHFALTDWYDMEQRMLLDGIGPNLRALFWMQGEQDATSTVAAPDSATHQSYIQSMVDDVRTYTGEASLPVVVGRIRDIDPTMNATAKAAVRAGQAAFVSANSGCVLIDTDSYALQVDNVHYNGSGQTSLGQAFYDATTW